MNRLLRVFLDVDMRGGHPMLSALAKENGVSVANLSRGEHLVFINRKATKMKLYSANQVLSYLAGGRRLELGTLQHFSECFGAEGFQYTNALRKVLESKLKNPQAIRSEKKGEENG